MKRRFKTIKLHVTIILTICLFSLVENLRAEEDIITGLAAKGIIFKLIYAETLEDKEHQRRVIENLSEDIFTYWYDSRYLRLRKSIRIEQIIKIFAHNRDLKYIPISKLINESLSDPLKLLGKGSSSKINKRWKFKTKKEYKEILKQFEKFLSEKTK